MLNTTHLSTALNDFSLGGTKLNLLNCTVRILNYRVWSKAFNHFTIIAWLENEVGVKNLIKTRQIKARKRETVAVTSECLNLDFGADWEKFLDLIFMAFKAELIRSASG